MRGSWRLARLAGVNIDVHWSFSLIILWVILQGALTHGKPEVIAFALVAVLLLFACVLLHELGHALVAARFQVPVKNIVLLPIGGLAQMQTLPENPLHEMVIAGAGPLVNLAIAVSLLPAMLVFTPPAFLVGFIHSPDTVLDAVLQSFFQHGTPLGLIVFLLLANLILFLFNLIPAFPMDGGRILRAGLALKVPYPYATQLAVNLGRAIAVGLILAAFYVKSPGLFFMAVFVLMAGRPLRYHRVRE